MHAVHGPAGGVRCHRREQGRIGDPEADLLAFHVAALKPERGQGRIAGGLGPVGDGDAREKQKAHGGQDGPTLALVADHATEDVGERRAKGEDRDHLDEVRQGGRVLERVGGIGVEEPAPVGAQHLDRDLGGDRPNRDRLLRAFERCRFNVRRQRLRDALPDEKQGIRDAERQQHVKGAAGDIDPEAADGADRRAGETPDEGHRQHDARSSRQEVLVREPEHLGEVRERALAAVVLPVGVRDKAGGRVEGQILRDRRHLLRIEGEDGLEPQHGVEDQKARDMEDQHGDGVGEPVLLVVLVNAGQGIQRLARGGEGPARGPWARP